MGVFATRSPFRPNHLGLSSVRLERVEQSEALGPVLHVCGADLMDGTPIFDIKPYLPIPTAIPMPWGLHRRTGEPLPAGGVSAPGFWSASRRTAERACWGVLAGIPVPGIRRTPRRVYGMGFAGQNVRFTVDGETLTVHSIDPLEK